MLNTFSKDAYVLKLQDALFQEESCRLHERRIICEAFGCFILYSILPMPIKESRRIASIMDGAYASTTTPGMKRKCSSAVRTARSCSRVIAATIKVISPLLPGPAIPPLPPFANLSPA